VSNYREFQFKSYEFVKESCTLYLRYAYDNQLAFEETVAFPRVDAALSEIDHAALDRAFRLIFLLSGVSYYKAYVPKDIRCNAFPLDAVMARFLKQTYTNGLSEFAYQNSVDLSDRVNFHSSSIRLRAAVRPVLNRGLLVPVGGGKDSIVSIECLKRTGLPMTLFAVGTAAGIASPILRTIEAAGLPFLLAKRTIDRRLIELNKDKATLNGHVPITAILSSIAVACALMQRMDTVVMSNEHSANSPNLRIAKVEVNHQYSKSLKFETAFARIVAKTISNRIGYFSLLRSLSEVEIGRRFAQLDSYHLVFRSCNAAFKQAASERAAHWCCNCPKCRFVFLVLAPFIAKDQLLRIFGANLLADESQLLGYEELCGIRNNKPFECVGSTEESMILMGKLFRSAEWTNDFVVSRLGGEIVKRHRNLASRFEKLLARRFATRAPAEYRRALDAN
jgi:hypothetical protein